MRRPSSSPSPAALSCLLVLAFLLVDACAFVQLRPPTSLAAASLRRQPRTISNAFEPSPLFARLRAPVAAAAAPVAPAAASGSGLLPRLKTMAQDVVTGLPVVALSTISGGFLAGSLHSVTGTCCFLYVCQEMCSAFSSTLCPLLLPPQHPPQRVHIRASSSPSLY